MAYHVHALAEMVENMKHIISFDEDMTIDECNLLSAAYKNVIGARCESWWIVSPIEQEEESKGHEAQVSMMGYRERIETQLQAIVRISWKFLGRDLIPSAASGESKVFYLRL